MTSHACTAPPPTPRSAGPASSASTWSPTRPTACLALPPATARTATPPTPPSAITAGQTPSWPPTATVKHALQCLGSGEIELVILDLGLPDGDGSQILKHIKAQKK